MTRYFGPYFMMRHHLAKLKSQEEELVATEENTERQYFSRTIDRKTFESIITDKHSELTTVRTQIRALQEDIGKLKHGHPFSMRKIQEKHETKPFILVRKYDALKAKLMEKLKRHKKELPESAKPEAKITSAKPSTKPTQPTFQIQSPKPVKGIELGGFDFDEMDKHKSSVKTTANKQQAFVHTANAKKPKPTPNSQLRPQPKQQHTRPSPKKEKSLDELMKDLKAVDNPIRKKPKS
jgi:hypothetical protein